MAILLGRAGMGKSQVAFEVCKRVDCIYIDMTELNEKNLANIAAVVAWRLLSRRLPRPRISSLRPIENLGTKAFSL